MVNPNNYFDLYDIFVNELVGSVWLFVFLALAVIWYLCIKYRTPFEIPIIFTVLAIGIIYAKMTGLIILWMFITLIIGVIFYFVYTRIWKR